MSELPHPAESPSPRPPSGQTDQPYASGWSAADDLPSRLFRQAVAAAGDGIIMIDIRRADQPIVYANQAFERLTGYPINEVIGRSYRFLQADDHDQPGGAIMRAALAEGRPATVLLRISRRDGALIWSRLLLSPVRDDQGQVTHVVGAQTDVTDQWADEARSRLLADIDQALLDQSDERAALTSLAERLAPALVDWCAIDLTERGPPRWTVARHRQETLTPLVRALPLNPLLTDEPTVQQGALRDRWTDAADRATVDMIGLTACVSLPLRLETRPFGHLVLALNQPGRAFGPAELALFGALAQRLTLLLEAARLRRVAEQAILQREEALSSISHELKTPITAIKGVAQMLQRRLEHGQAVPVEKLLHDLRAIDDAANRLTAAISQLLAGAHGRKG